MSRELVLVRPPVAHMAVGQKNIPKHGITEAAEADRRLSLCWCGHFAYIYIWFNSLIVTYCNCDDSELTDDSQEVRHISFAHIS